MLRYIVKINFDKGLNFDNCEIDCRHIEFNNISIKLYKSDYNVIKCINLNDIESIEVKPYVHYIRHQPN